MFVDHDILELIEDFRESAVDRLIKVELANLPSVRFNLASAILKGEKHG